jgi:uroporphyrinogen-III synthase
MMLNTRIGNLRGRRIVVTRAPHQADVLADRLQLRGAIPILFPCIDIAPPADTTTLDDALLHLQAFDWLVLTSPNTVRVLAHRLQALRLSPDWARLRLAAVGCKTASAMQEYLHIQPHVVPAKQAAVALAHVIDTRPGQWLLLPQSDIASSTLADLLQAKEARVYTVAAYRNVIGHGGADVSAMLRTGDIDMLTFTSASTAKNFLERVPEGYRYKVPVVCIGPSAARAAEDAHFQNILVPDDYSLDGLLQAIEDYFGASTYGNREAKR